MWISIGAPQHRESQSQRLVHNRAGVARATSMPGETPACAARYSLAAVGHPPASSDRQRRCVRGKPGAAVGRRVHSTSKQRLARRHPGEIKPAMARIEFHRNRFLLVAVRIDQVGSDERSSAATLFASQSASGVSRNGPRIGRHRVDHLHPAFQKLNTSSASAWQVLAHTIGAGRIGLIDMDPRRRLPRASAADIGRAIGAPPHRVVKDEHAVGAQCGPDKRLPPRDSRPCVSLHRRRNRAPGSDAGPMQSPRDRAKNCRRASGRRTPEPGAGSGSAVDFGSPAGGSNA